ncbi:MAG: hypothetical protein LBI19_07060 [Oscillospiraceae bacterium]|nr:hypothetical protein [Oscillospiraceae bacterium]
MSQKKEGNKVLDVLEKMRVIKKTDDDTELELEALEDAVSAMETESFEVPPAQPAPSPPVYNPVPETPYGISGEDKNLFWDEQPQSGESTEQYLDIGHLYNVFNMKTQGVDTIYLIESYISTLPETLPAELRRSIILKIIAASGFDFDQLLNDGIDRVSQLNDYSARFASRTEEIVERHNVEIDALERQIQQIREAINERKNLHKRQFLTIESEAQRLKDVLDFITK